MKYEYDYPMAAHTVDMVVFRHSKDSVLDWEVLLIERGGEPYKGCLALPGGFANKGETLKQAGVREILEEAGLVINPNFVELVDNYDEPGRDPRGWTISTAFTTFVDRDAVVQAGDDAVKADWYPCSYVEHTDLAFDHKQIIGDAYRFHWREANDS